MGEYLNAFANKYAQEKQDKEALGTALGAGIGSSLLRGTEMNIANKQKDIDTKKAFVLEGVKKYMNDNTVMSGGQMVDPALYSEILGGVADGSIKFKKDTSTGGMVFATKDGNSIGITVEPKQTMTYAIDENGMPVLKGSVPKGAVNTTPKVAPSDKILINVDSEGKLFDVNMKPITDGASIDWSKVVKNQLPKDIMQSSNAQTKSQLAQGGIDSVNDINTSINTDVFTDLKIAMKDPTGLYKESLTENSKKVFAGLRNAVGNILYIKTGAAATPKEIDEQMDKYSPSLNQSLDDWKKNTLGLLTRDLNYYMKPENNKDGKPQPKSQPQTGKQGGVMHIDANGNRAIVYPDGTFEEVK